MPIHEAQFLTLHVHLTGGYHTIFRIKRFWDAKNNFWVAVTRTPLTNRTLAATGKDTAELLKNFLTLIYEHIQDEVLQMINTQNVWATFD